MMTPFRIKNIENTSNHTNRWYSSRQEQEVAKKVGGRQTANSGATPLSKEDIVNDLFTFECKTKTKNSDSFTLKREWFDKQIAENIQMCKPYKALVFNFGPDKPYNENHYIIDESLFLELLEYLRAKND